MDFWDRFIELFLDELLCEKQNSEPGDSQSGEE